MHIRAIITLAVALIMGGVTVFLINNYLNEEVRTRTATQVIETTPVVVAASDLNAGSKLEDIQLKVIDWPTAVLPENVYQTVEAVIGEAAPVVLTEVKAGELILPYKLSPHGARGGLPSRIPEDKRAIAIAVNEVKGVAGFLMPGDYVDILHTTNVGRLDERLVTRIVLQNVLILGIDQIDTEEDKPRVVNAVTLLVNTYDAQRLTLAQNLGDLNLVLRNEFDASILEETAVTYKELLNADKDRKVKVYKRIRRAPSVEVIRGLEVSKQQVKEGVAPAKEAQPSAQSKAKK
ncbi:MAG: Flp pilus assembly protein CpaB [Sinobacterium sp.]|nr:Flp pilus assembly protein CpaB [Sinobacterium sp.]